MVCADHGYLGIHHGAYGVHQDAYAFLSRSNPARRCRSRFLSRHPRLSHALVPVRRPRKSRLDVHDCDSRREHRRRAARRMAPGRALVRHSRMALAVYFGGYSRDRVWHGHVFYLTDWPREAHWLSLEERAWITAELEQEALAKRNARSYTIWQALRQPSVIRLAFIYFFGVSSIYALTIWLPTFLKSTSGKSDLSVTLLSILPYVFVLFAMLFNGWHSDRTGERRWHTALPLMCGAVAFALTILAGSHFWLAFGCLIVAASANSFLVSFWPIPSAFLGESAAAASIGLINSIGNLGSFVTPSVIGFFLDRTHSFAPGFLYVIGSLLIAIYLLLTLRMRPTNGPAE